MTKAPRPKVKLKREIAAYHIWDELVGIARRRDPPTTYSALSDTIGSVDRRLGWPLGLIQDYCLLNNPPPLTILVVSKTTGRPGHGFTALGQDALEAGLAEVRAYDWPKENPFAFATTNETLNSLVKKAAKSAAAAAEVYALVKTRGMAQVVFRRGVLEAYGYQCAFCGVGIVECLEAAHVIPWTLASEAQRISPNNGICLCRNHHKLFDQGYVTVGWDNKIFCRQVQKGRKFNAADRMLTTGLHGGPVYVPSKTAHRIHPAHLGLHHDRFSWSRRKGWVRRPTGYASGE